ncbi:MAG: DUF308 domain-containing protein [Candidatus Dojkabacteria bacterium]|nr:MAG: DUF308 domain-containing protein [Candidatus Dojkabacteria bacterium]
MQEGKVTPGLLFFRGLLAVIFGMIVVAWPGISLATIVLLMGLFLLIDGIVGIVMGFFSIGKDKHWYLMVLLGLLAVIGGVLVFNYTKVTFITVVTIFGAMTIASGIVDFINFFRFKKEVDNRFLLLLAGVVNILFGTLLVVHPLVTSVAYMWVIGLTALFAGIFSIVASIKLKREVKKGKK